MRLTLIVPIAVSVGCAAPLADTSKHPGGARAPDAQQVAVANDAPLAAAEPTVASPTPTSKDEIAILVKSVVAEEFAKRDRQHAEATEAAVQKHAAEQRSIEETAELAAQQAEKMAALQATRDAAEAAQQEDVALARFLLLPDEVDRVERVQAKLEADSIWGLTLQDLDFAAEGLSAPLLHDALYKAAERYDPAIEMDVLSRKAGLSAQEKIQFATMPPIARQQLLVFTEQLDKGEKSVAGDRYIREYINRYPFIRKILLPYLHQPKPAP